MGPAKERYGKVQAETLMQISDRPKFQPRQNVLPQGPNCWGFLASCIPLQNWMRSDHQRANTSTESFVCLAIAPAEGEDGSVHQGRGSAPPPSTIPFLNTFSKVSSKIIQEISGTEISGVVFLPVVVTILDKWQDSSFRHKGLIHVENLRILLFDHIMNRTHVKPRRIADTTCKISSPKPNATAEKFMLAFIFWSASNPLKIGFHNKKTTRQICRL